MSPFERASDVCAMFAVGRATFADISRTTRSYVEKCKEKLPLFQCRMRKLRIILFLFSSSDDSDARLTSAFGRSLYVNDSSLPQLGKTNVVAFPFLFRLFLEVRVAVTATKTIQSPIFDKQFDVRK